MIDYLLRSKNGSLTDQQSDIYLNVKSTQFQAKEFFAATKLLINNNRCFSWQNTQ